MPLTGAGAIALTVEIPGDITNYFNIGGGIDTSI
jgi:hypothetical protein